MTISLELQGLEQVTQNLQRLVQAPIPPLHAALRTEGNQIIRVANELVPVDTGLLRSTGAVETPVQEGSTASVTMRYGGHGLAPYAARIEFDVSLNHPHGGQAHFLQGSMHAATAGLMQRLATALRGALP